MSEPVRAHRAAERRERLATEPLRARRAALLLRWLPALVWMAVIFVLSSQSGLAVTEDPGTERPIRIVAHLATYALLGGLLLFALAGWTAPRPRTTLLAFGLAALYAMGDELHQAFVPGRSGRPNDVVVDVVGAALGLALAAAMLNVAAGRRSAASGPRATAGSASGSSAGSLEGDGTEP